MRTKRLLSLLLPCCLLLSSPSLAAQTGPEDDPDVQYGAELLKPGTEAPAFSLSDINGKTVKIKDLRGKNVVLVFWASWCPDCRAEVPVLKEMHAAANPAKTVFVSVSFDREFAKFQQYVRANELPGIQLFDPSGKKDSKVGGDYHIKWIPSLYLIGPDGKIRFATVVAERAAAALRSMD